MNKLYRYIALATLLFTGCSEYTADVEYADNIDERIISFVSFNEIHPSAPNCVSVIWDSETGDGAIGFDEAITTIPYGIFTGAQGLTSVWLPDGTTSINDNAFDSCVNLKSITIPYKVTYIGDGAFSNCHQLTSVIIPNKVTQIRPYTFYFCDHLCGLKIGDHVVKIGDWAFAGCSSLTSVTIPDSVTEIGLETFSDCSSLTSVYCKATTPPAGGNNMFYGNASNRKIYVPMESVNKYKSASGWSSYASAIVGYNFK